jgi:16S rRNA (adenine1518-N6/adenine1519-N6)-dimethyltransferase
MKGLAKKRFGQNFLRDSGVLDRIVHVVHPLPDDLIVELGAGHGELSARLARDAGRLVAVELDRDCVPELQSALASFPSASILNADMLRVAAQDLWQEYGGERQRLRFVGNLPYNIATPVIDRLLHSTAPIADMVFMLQLEVAQRIVAAPGSRDYGLLSVTCQHLAAVKLAFKVNPAAFVPRPKVSSAIVVLTPKRARPMPDFEANFSKILKAAFGHRRKTLANSLREDPALAPAVRQLLELAAIDGRRRAEELSVEEYERLASGLAQI